MSSSTSPPPPNGGEVVYQLKIALMYTKPLIWRRIHVTDSTTLETFHHILQTSMGWNDSHSFKFTNPGVDYYSQPDYDELGLDFGIKKKSKLSEVIKAGKQLIYTYDFGDDWEHDIILEKVLPIEEGKSYPICVAGHLACPPDDCGGTPGYYGLLKSMKDSNALDAIYHLEFLERVLGGTFDPNKFELDSVNEQLRAQFS